jgi:LacI family transcriptional regulator
MKSKSPASLRQIAEQTGLSRMAVSMALRGKPGVAESTRKRVAKAAARLGYVPDPEVSKLLSRIRSRSIGEPKECLALLTSGEKRGSWRSFPTESKYVEGAERRSREYGYRLEEFWIDDPSMPPARLSKILWNRGIEGIVLAPIQGRLPEKNRSLTGFNFDPFCSVEISETVETPSLDRAIHDQYTSMRLCLAELASLGYGSVGLVLERALDLRANGRWTAAFLERQFSASGPAAPPPLVLETASSSKFSRWFSRHRPDAIVSVDGFALSMLAEAGLSIPRDVAYASLDLDGEAGGRGRFAGIDQNSHLVGAAAVDVLVAAIQRGQTGIPRHPIRLEIEGTWIGGASAPGKRRKGLRKFTRSLPGSRRK